MGYYRGDYRGDYYRGSIFSAIGKVVKGVAKTAIGLLPGPVGTIARAVTNAPRKSIAVGPGSGIASLPTIGIGGPLGPISLGPTGITSMGQNGFAVRRGRRMNVTNVRALRRAGRRVRGFLKLAGKLGALPVSKSAKGKLFKRKRR